MAKLKNRFNVKNQSITLAVSPAEKFVLEAHCDAEGSMLSVFIKEAVTEKLAKQGIDLKAESTKQAKRMLQTENENLGDLKEAG